MSSTIQIKRRTNASLDLIVNGEKVGTVHQTCGNGRLYTAKAYGTEFTGLGQKDLIDRINDYVNKL